jgi:hypothetical protein
MGLNNNIETIKEVISNLIYKTYPIEDSESSAIIKRVNDFLSLASDSYLLIEWPDVQDYMEENWFDNEAILSESSSYLIPLKRII